MTDNEKYLTIRQTTEVFNKSTSTINRLIRKLRNEDIRVFEGEKILSKTRLNNKSYKTLILKSYLTSIYVSSSVNEKENDIPDDTPEVSNRVLSILEKELEEKNKQIEQLHILLERQNQRMDLFNKMMKLKGKEQISSMVNDTELDIVEIPVDEELEEIDIPNDTPDDIEDFVEGNSLQQKEEPEELEMEEEEKKLDERRLSFLSWLEEKKHSKSSV